MSTDNRITEDLKDVIERNVDAYKGYEKAAEKVNNANLATAFQKQAQQRKQFAVELEAQTHVLGDDAQKKLENGTFESNLHRTWMDFKTAFSADNEEAVLEECIRGEKEALEEYNELINNHSLTSSSYELISNQRNVVQTCLNELKSMERIVD